VDDQDDHFTPDATLRIQRLLRLRRDLGINYNAAGLILDLLERIDDLEARLQRYESGSTASEPRKR
jgi:chaperone modulatory protein CbpM